MELLWRNNVAKQKLNKRQSNWKDRLLERLPTKDVQM